VHLVGFIIRIYHDARSAERQIQNVSYSKYARFMVLKKMSFKIAECNLWGFGPHNFRYGTVVSTEPADVIFRDFTFKKEAAGFSEETHTHSQTHIHSHTTLSHTHTHTHLRSHTHSHTLTHTHTHTQSLSHTHTLTHSHTHSHTLSLAHTHTHAHRHTHTHSHTHSQTHTHTDLLTTLLSKVLTYKCDLNK